jgi:hypothetical protein
MAQHYSSYPVKKCPCGKGDLIPKGIHFHGPLIELVSHCCKRLWTSDRTSPPKLLTSNLAYYQAAYPNG